MRHHSDFGGHEIFVNWKIPSDYNENMSRKSVVVCLNTKIHVNG